MRFEDFPEVIEADISASAALAAAALDDGRQESLHSYGERLVDGVSPDSGPAETLVAIEGLVCEFMLGRDDARRRHDSALTPWIEMGGQVTPPPVRAFPGGARDYLTTRAFAARRADVRARLHDFGWERWRDVADARGAIDGYLEATQVVDYADPGEANDAMEYLIRAAELSLQVRHRQAEVRASIAAYSRLCLLNDYPSWILEQTVDLLKADPDLSGDLIDATIGSARDAATRGDRHAERGHLTSALALAAALKRHAQADTIRRSIAASHEAEAAERASEGGMIESFTLTAALRARMDLGDTAAVQRIRRELVEANRRALDEMHTVTAEVRIADGDIESFVSSLSASRSSEPTAIRAFPREAGLWPAWSSGEPDQDGVLLSLASTTVLEHDARSVPLPDPGPEREAALAVRRFSERVAIACGLAQIALQRLRSRGYWLPETVAAAIADVDAALGRVCEPGIRAFEAGEWWVALHVLAPQVERAVRTVGDRLDAPIQRATTAQRLMWAQLDPLLEDEVIRTALGDDFARELEAVFTSEYGPNIRNNVAHGAAALDKAETPALICLLAILTIADVLATLLVAESE